MFVIRHGKLCHGVRRGLQTRGIFWQRNDFRRDDWFITKIEGRVKMDNYSSLPVPSFSSGVFDSDSASDYFRLAGGTMLFIRKYSTSCP